ncbi:MAG: N-6 DNA methylase [Promethearchaeota archaeon]
MDIKKLIGSEEITKTFGINSEIYAEVIGYLKEQASSEKDYNLKFQKWRDAFSVLYGNDISSDLFLTHTYFTTVLKALVISKIGVHNNRNFDDIYENMLKRFHVFENEYFFWTILKKNLFEKIFTIIKNSTFAKQDLFSQFYQQMFVSNIRHKKGEFYTPTSLARKMIDDVYRFGSKVLDPSCGSGIFIINIILRILDSQKSLPLKIEAISNLFGFDVNPLALITTKANILLIFLEYLKVNQEKFPKINIFLCDSLFPNSCNKVINLDLNDVYSSFDLVLGNPPWLTYKDLFDKSYQTQIRELSEKLNIKPPSQYITHIELAAVFFYAIPHYFLKERGKIFFVMPKSVLNGDHCHKFRAFSIFNKNLEIWDFPNNYFFNVNHICLKAEFIGFNNSFSIDNRYPIKTKIFDRDLELQEEIFYSSLKIDKEGAKLILPKKELSAVDKVDVSSYKKKFFQGATLVPRTLVFFQIRKELNKSLIIDSDPDVLTRAKAKWNYRFEGKEIEQKFHFITFLNIDLLPFHLKNIKNVFLPINDNFEYNPEFLESYPKAQKFYNEMNTFYREHKKETSKIATLYDNLNYWNKLQKQNKNKAFLVVYNASGSSLKSAVINNTSQKVIVGSENYYYSTDEEEEAYYLSAILNSPNLSSNIKLIKSSRHIHKRPFMFPIPAFDEDNPIHKKLAKKGKTCHGLVQEICINNPKITAEKVRIFINRKLMKIKELTQQIVFK